MLMVGYRASFTAAFAWIIVACLIGFYGLSGIREIDLKEIS